MTIFHYIVFAGVALFIAIRALLLAVDKLIWLSIYIPYWLKHK